MEFIQIEVRMRDERGTAAMNRLRREGLVPAVLYGLERRNLSLTIPGDELERFVRSGSHLVELTMGDESRDAILREVQHDPITEAILHVDFQRVDKDAAVEDSVPITFKGMAAGTKEGGLFQGLMDGLRVSARPRDLPDGLLVDISGLHVGDAIHVRDLRVPDVVTVLDGEDALVAHVVAMRGRADELEEEGAAEEAPTEPEVVGKESSAEDAGD
jgi:large subunit ribosomal protein L25